MRSEEALEGDRRTGVRVVTAATTLGEVLWRALTGDVSIQARDGASLVIACDDCSLAFVELTGTEKATT